MAETIKLYEEDSFLQSCQGTVLSCTQGPEGFLVELDRTVFFPEGGGQPSDRGILGGVPVTYVFERDGRVLHLCEAPLPVGEQVEGAIDFDRRLDMMQQHSGEHIFAGVAHRLFGANSVGFHLGEDSLRVDFDHLFTPEELELLEEESNRMIWENHPVSASYLSEEAYRTLPMRKKAENIQGRIRMVVVDEVDTVTCCGTHVRTSAQVGVIKILSSERYKGGSRVDFVCGGRALRDYRQKNQTVLTLAASFSVKPQGLVDAVARQGEALLEQTRLLQSQRAKALTRLARELLAGARQVGGRPLVEAFPPELTAEEAKELTLILLREPEVVAMVLAAEGERLFYLFGSGPDSGVDVRPICRAAGELLGGRGGGKPNLCQGSAPLPKDLGEVRSALGALLDNQVQEGID